MCMVCCEKDGENYGITIGPCRIGPYVLSIVFYLWTVCNIRLIELLKFFEPMYDDMYLLVN